MASKSSNQGSMRISAGTLQDGARAAPSEAQDVMWPETFEQAGVAQSGTLRHFRQPGECFGKIMLRNMLAGFLQLLRTEGRPFRAHHTEVTFQAFLA